jgi:NitT/TauT family transport system permease protein
MSKYKSPLIVIIAIAVCWEALYLWIGDSSMSSPAQAVKTLGSMLLTAEFWNNAAETGEALLYALAIALVGGILIGFLLGMSKMAGLVAEPILLNLYSLPKVTLYPLVLLVFGLGISAKVAFGVMHGLIPISLFTMNAIRQMKPVYFRVSTVLRMPWHQTLYRIVLPAILPEVVSGLSLGFSLTLLGVLIGEMFASSQGIGYMLTNAMNLGDMKTILALALFLSVFALSCNGLLTFAKRKVGHQ